MKNFILLCMFVFFLLNGCAKEERFFKYEIGYDDNSKEYITYVYGDFKKCNNLKTIISKGKKVYDEREFKGETEAFVINIPVNRLERGLFDLEVFCDGKKDERKIEIWNFSFPLLRKIFTGSFSDGEIDEITKNILESEIFISELKTYINFSEENFVKSAKIFEYLPPKEKFNLLIDLAKKYKSSQSNLIFYQVLSSSLYEPASLDLIDVLFERKDKSLDANLFNIIITRPEERFFDRFFNLFLEREHLKNSLVEFMKQDKESPFSKKVIRYVKKGILDGKLRKDYFITQVAKDYFYINPYEYDFYLELLKSKDRWEDGIELLEKNDIDESFAEKILHDWEYLNLTSKKYLVRRILEKIKDFDLFVEKLKKEKDIFFAEYITLNLHRLSNPYNPDNKDYVKNLVEKGCIDGFIISYVNNIDDIDYKRDVLIKIYEKTNDFNRLLDIKDIDKKYFVSALEKMLTSEGDPYYFAVGEMVLLGDDYFELLTKHYREKDKLDKNRMLMSFSYGGEKWGWFVYNELTKRDYREEDKFIYKNIALHAKGRLRSKIIEDLKKLPKDKFIALTLGIEEARYDIDCQNVLGDLLKIKKDTEEIKRIGWMWAYCCPNDYLTYYKYALDTQNEDILSNAMEGFIDIVDILNVDIKDKIRKPLKETYEKYDSKLIRDKFFTVFQYIGQKNDLDELNQLIEKISGEEKEQLMHYLDLLKERIEKEGAK